MTEHQNFSLCFNYTPRCPFTKSTLSAKIINLRKVSQENHVRRMKLAYQKKEKRNLVDCSSCLSPPFPKQRSPNKSSFVSSQGCSGNLQSKRKVNFDLLPAKVNTAVNRMKYSDSSKSISEKKKNQNRISNTKNKPSSNFSEGKFRHLHISKSNKSMIESNDCRDTKFQKKMKTSLSIDECESPSFNKKLESARKADKPLLKVSSVATKNKNNIGEGNSKNNSIAKKKPTKIPVFKSRLIVKDNDKENKRCIVKNLNEIVEEALESMLNDVENKIVDLNMSFEEHSTMNVPFEADLEKETNYQDPVCKKLPDYSVENQTKELNLQQTTEKQNGDADIKAAQTSPSLIDQCYEEESCRDLYQTFCEEEKSRYDEISLIDKWMNGILEDADSGKNSSESSPMSKFLNEKISLQTLKKNCDPETLDINEFSGDTSKYDYINDRTESENYSEIFYEFEEKYEKCSSNLDNMDRWQNLNFEADSTITVPSDKDLEVEDYRDPAYRNLPDYPNTPYNLRYPRYKFKVQNDVFNSTETKFPYSTNREKSLKNRKKSCNATTKRLKSVKKKKIKKISPKKDASF